MENTKMMEMSTIYLNLERWRDYYAEDEKKYKELYEKAKRNREQIELTLMQLEEGNFTMPQQEETKEVKVEATEDVVEMVKTPEKKKTDLVWKHKNAVLVKYGKDGTKLGTYSSQRKLAEQLGVTQTTVGYWMKEPVDVQIKKRNFYIKYEY